LSENSRKSWIWPSLAWCFGVLAMTGIWMTISVWLNQPCLWMAALSAIDLGLILRFTGVGAGWPRFTGIVIGTLLISVASQWIIAANAFGLVMGLLPLESIQMVGRVLVWEFTRLRIEAPEPAYLLISTIIAWFLGLRPLK